MAQRGQPRDKCGWFLPVLFLIWCPAPFLDSWNMNRHTLICGSLYVFVPTAVSLLADTQPHKGSFVEHLWSWSWIDPSGPRLGTAAVEKWVDLVSSLLSWAQNRAVFFKLCYIDEKLVACTKKKDTESHSLSQRQHNFTTGNCSQDYKILLECISFPWDFPPF